MKTSTGTCCYAGEEFGASPMPKIFDWMEDSDDWPPPSWSNFDHGDCWTCPTCGTVYVATWVPDQVGQYVVHCAHWEWRKETFWQRTWRLLRASLENR